MTAKQLARFIAKLRFEDRDEDLGECWIWTGHRRVRDYGGFVIAGSTKLAHRVAYEHFVGQIPADTELDHLCRQPSCVNPRHLEPVSHTENVRRGGSCKATPYYTPNPEHLARARACRTLESFKRAGQKIGEALRGRPRMDLRGKSMPPRSAATREKMAAARRAYWVRKRNEAA